MSYITVGKCGQYEFIEKRSRFIGRAGPADSEEKALAFAEACRAEHPDASHHVYCYVLRQGNTIRFNDDGEPSGTAGKPALNVFLQEKVFDAVCVITRYFGGVLLGAGGLARAYSHAAKGALDAAGRVQLVPCVDFTAEIPYKLWGRVENTLCGRADIEVHYGEFITLRGNIYTDAFQSLQNDVLELTSGSVVLQAFGDSFRQKEIL